MRSTQDLVQIVSNGGGVIVNSSTPTRDLVQIVSNAVGNGGRVIIKGAVGMVQQDLVQIASNGRGVVIFDFTE
jgi:hypothetical protein